MNAPMGRLLLSLHQGWVPLAPGGGCPYLAMPNVFTSAAKQVWQGVLYLELYVGEDVLYLEAYVDEGVLYVCC